MNNDNNPFRQENIDNKDITISLLTRQLEDKSNENKILSEKLEVLTERILDLEGIKKDIEVAKKKAKYDVLKPKYSARCKLDWDVIMDICSYILKGLTVEQSCENLGINKGTYYNWLNQGKKDIEGNKKTIFADYFNAINKTRTALELRYRDVLENEVKKGNVEITKYLLKVVNPSKYNVSTKNVELSEQIELSEEKTLTISSGKINPEVKETFQQMQKLIKKKSIKLTIDDEEIEDDIFE